VAINSLSVASCSNFNRRDSSVRRLHDSLSIFEIVMLCSCSAALSFSLSWYFPAKIVYVLGSPSTKKMIGLFTDELDQICGGCALAA
jgi:hypothetical protein